MGNRSTNYTWTCLFNYEMHANDMLQTTYITVKSLQHFTGVR